ncbi:MAG TPA: DUF4112 domain-containing protein [Methylomirabilota bacterium]|nr:DUF4112 domain-containing protein [Methylomirabilota bacterium]
MALPSPVLTATDFSEGPSKALRLRLEALSRLMDSAVRVPGTQFRFGADAVMAIIPGIGSLAASAISAYLVIEATRFGISRRDLARMVGNILVDTAVGSVPVAGVLFDAAFKANNRNMTILREHIDRTEGVIDHGPLGSGTSR